MRRCDRPGCTETVLPWLHQRYCSLRCAHDPIDVRAVDAPPPIPTVPPIPAPPVSVPALDTSPGWLARTLTRLFGGNPR